MLSWELIIKAMFVLILLGVVLAILE